MMDLQKIEQYVDELAEGTSFLFVSLDINDATGKIDFTVNGENPENEDWWFDIDIEIPENTKELVTLLYIEFDELYENYDVEEEVYRWLKAKRNGFSGVPGVVDLVKNELYKEAALKSFATKLEKIKDECERNEK